MGPKISFAYCSKIKSGVIGTNNAFHSNEKEKIIKERFNIVRGISENLKLQKYVGYVGVRKKEHLSVEEDNQV